MSAKIARVALLVALAVCTAVSQAQYLYWKLPKGTPPVTAVYGEIQVLATSPMIYYCGLNWWPSAAAGGYAGIQDNDSEKRAIFSIWDTTKELHPETVATDPRIKATRFKGEGTGAHNHLVYDWKVGQTFRYYITKRPDPTGQNTMVTTYFFDEGVRRWVMMASVRSPIGEKAKSVTTFGGVLNSFLENYGGNNHQGRDRQAPKLALYRLWAGTKPDDLAPVTSSSGKGKWGVLNGSFFLAEGDDDALKPYFTGDVVFGEQAVVQTIPAKPIPSEILASLRRLS